MFSKEKNSTIQIDPQLLFETLPVGLVIIDSETRRILAVNPAAAEMSGFNAEEMLGSLCHDYLCPASTGNCPILDQHNEIDRSERKMLRRKKPPLPILKSAVPIVYEGKRALLEAIVDLSEQQNLIRTIFHAIPDMIWMKDLNGVYQLCNPAFEKFMGQPETQIIGKTDYDFVSPEMADIFSESDRNARLAGVPCMNEESVHFAGDDREAWLETTKTPVFNNNGEVIGTFGISHDITVRRENLLRLERNTLIQTALRKIAEVTMTHDSITNFYRLLADIITQLFPGTSFFISLIDEQHAFLKSPFLVDPWGVLSETRPLAKGFREYVLAQNQAVYLSGSDCESLYRKGVIKHRLPADSQWIGAPLFQNDGKPIGVTGIFFIGTEHILTEADKEIFAVAATNISLTMERFKAEEDLKESYRKLLLSQEATIRILSNTAEIKDAYTAGHQRRVAELASAAAFKMGLTSDEFQRTLKMAAMIHDIGKISIPSEILSKPGGLSPLEFELIKLHSQVGYDLLRGEDISADIAKIIYQHHERLDGSGYPNGLKDGDICLEARIIAVADVVEAMSSFRPYRPALGMDLALAEIRGNSGILYDPDVVAACASILSDGSFGFSE